VEDLEISSEIVTGLVVVGYTMPSNAALGSKGGLNRNAKDLACQLTGHVAGSRGSFWDCFGRNRWWERKVLFENVFFYWFIH